LGGRANRPAEKEGRGKADKHPALSAAFEFDASAEFSTQSRRALGEFMNIWAWIVFGLKQTPDGALAVIRQLEPENWEMLQDDVPVASSAPKFNAMGSVKNRMLVMDNEYSLLMADSSVKQRSMTAMTRFKNDGTDTLEIDGVPMTGVNFKFHSKPLASYFRVVMFYIDENKVPRVIEFVNKKTDKKAND
jgi:hypothetical protein